MTQTSLHSERMLTITETAAQVINTLISDSQMPEGAGLRIAPQQERSETLEISVAPEPAEQDTIVESAGATVFLEPHAEEALRNQILDVQPAVQGDGSQYQFAVIPQPST
ncbi:MAG: adhesin [Pseudonocardiaceae bacterium]